jgi:hypothetical protein
MESARLGNERFRSYLIDPKHRRDQQGRGTIGHLMRGRKRSAEPAGVLPAHDVVHDRLELRREAVLVVDALEREDCADDARELVDDRPGGPAGSSQRPD